MKKSIKKVQTKAAKQTEKERMRKEEEEAAKATKKAPVAKSANGKPPAKASVKKDTKDNKPVKKDTKGKNKPVAKKTPAKDTASFETRKKDAIKELKKERAKFNYDKLSTEEQNALESQHMDFVRVAKAWKAAGVLIPKFGVGDGFRTLNEVVVPLKDTAKMPNDIWLITRWLLSITPKNPNVGLPTDKDVRKALIEIDKAMEIVVRGKRINAKTVPVPAAKHILAEHLGEIEKDDNFSLPTLATITACYCLA